MKKFIVTTLSSLVLVTSILSSNAAAAGTATLSLSPSSGSYTSGNIITVTISENSGTESVNVIEADLNYNASQLQFVNITCNGAFEIAASANASGITCGTITPKTGPQMVGTATFKALASGSISFAGSSAIYSSANANIWNGVTAGANYTVSEPVVVTTPTVVTPTAPAPRPVTPIAVVPPTSEVAAPTIGVVEAASTKLYTVSIKVVDYRGDAVANAYVKIGGKTVKSDRNGKASFNDIKSGSYTVQVNSGKLNSSAQFIVADKNKPTQCFMVSLPRAKRSRLGLLLGSGVGLLIIGGGAAYTLRKRTPNAQANNKAVKKAKNPDTRLVTAKQ